MDGGETRDHLQLSTTVGSRWNCGSGGAGKVGEEVPGERELRGGIHRTRQRTGWARRERHCREEASRALGSQACGSGWLVCPALRRGGWRWRVQF